MPNINTKLATVLKIQPGTAFIPAQDPLTVILCRSHDHPDLAGLVARFIFLKGRLGISSRKTTGFYVIPAAQQFLNFFPLPQGHGSFLPGSSCETAWFSLFLIHLITLAGGRLAASSRAI